MLKLLRVVILIAGLAVSPIATSVFAQSNENANANRAGERREETRDRRDDKDFPWGLLGLAGLLGLLGMRKPKRDIYVDQRDAPPSRDVPPPRR